MSEIPRHWKPLREITRAEFKPTNRKIIDLTMSHYGIGEAEARAVLDGYDAQCRFYINDLYNVQTRPCGNQNSMLHINIRRRDGGMVRDWRHFQQIKNEVAGPECEAVEIFPAESRKVDTCNKWHLWVFPEGVQVSLGWSQRDVQYDENRDVPGMRQRPL